MSKPAGRGEELDRLVARARAELRDWADAPQHDPALAIVELLAYVGDIIGSYQDVIADEAHLNTARRRPARIRIEVDGERWHEVPDLADSGPDDDHFVATTQDDGTTAIQFGDGEHGRRPPQDSAIRARYRPGKRYTSVLLQEGRVVIDADWNEAPDAEVCGIYRGKVLDNVDPLMKRRLRVLIPEVMGEIGVWAMACMPPGDPDTVPSLGDPIWVAFESGDPDQPVWLGRLFT